jgi:hypothetical protein
MTTADAKKRLLDAIQDRADVICPTINWMSRRAFAFRRLLSGIAQQIEPHSD